ncbi:E3L [Bat mastadenovirus]|nr:E3L [Bat mastadenovirus]
MVAPEVKLPMQEVESWVKKLPYYKMEDPANYEFLAICWGVGFFLLLCILLIYCYYRYRVGKLMTLFGSGFFLIGEAKAEEGESVLNQMCKDLDWWEWATIGLVVVAAVCTVVVLAIVCWKYPPRCRKGKGLWFTAPLLLLFVAVPASQADHIVPKYAYPQTVILAQEGETVWLHPQNTNFSELQWVKRTWNGTLPVAFTNASTGYIDHSYRNQTGIKLLSLYGNSTLKLVNIAYETRGSYEVTFDKNSSSTEGFYLMVERQLQAPKITVQKLNTTGCTLLCRCEGENLTFEGIKGNTTWHLNNTVLLHPEDVRFLRCTSVSKSSSVSRSTLVSVKEVCTPKYQLQIIYANDFWWFVMAVLLIVIFCHLWFHRMANLFERRRAWLYTPFLLLMIAAPAQAYIVADYIPDINQTNSRCIYVPRHKHFNRYQAVPIITNQTIVLETKCLLGSPTTWYVDAKGNGNQEFLEFNGHSYFIVPENLEFCNTYRYNYDEFECELKTDVKKITAYSKSSRDGSTASETFFFNYGNSNPKQEIFAAPGDTIILHCNVNQFLSHPNNAIIWKFNNKSIAQRQSVDTPFLSNLPKNCLLESDLSLIIKKINKENFGEYECKTQFKPNNDDSIRTKLKSYFYLITNKNNNQAAAMTYIENPSTAQPNTDSNKFPIWGVILIIFGMIIVVLIILWSLLINKSSKITKIACLSPLILTVCIPPTNAVIDSQREIFDILVQENENLMLNQTIDAVEEITWKKCKNDLCIQTTIFVQIKEESITKFTHNFQKIGLNQVDVTSEKIILKNVKKTAAGLYQQSLGFQGGIGKDVYYNISVIEVQKQISISPTPQVITIPVYSELRNTWWVILLVIITSIVFIGIGVKVYITKDIGIPETTYSPKKGLTNPLLITIACLCLLLPSPIQGGHICKPEKHQYYFMSNTSQIINVSIDLSEVKQISWGIELSKNQAQLLVEWSNYSIHYFKSDFELLANGSLAIYNVTKNMTGVYKLKCVKDKGEIDEAVVILNVTEQCVPPKMSITTSKYEDPFKGACRVVASCFSANSNGVQFVSPVNPTKNSTAYYQSQEYWLFSNSTAPVYATCNCTNRFGSAYTQVELRRECADSNTAYHLLIHPITYVSMHHLWWILGLMIFLGGLIVAAYWWWTKRRLQQLNAPHGLSDPERPTAPLQDPENFV